MARYNTVSSTSSVAGGSTITTPYSGLLTTLTGTGTVTVPNPVYYLGSTQTYYNSTGSAITLSTPSGVINGPGLGGGATTLNLPAGSIITLISDGTNYLTQDWLGGNISSTTLSATTSVNLSTSGTITISPGTTSNLDNMIIGANTARAGSFSALVSTSGRIGNLNTAQFSGSEILSAGSSSNTSLAGGFVNASTNVATVYIKNTDTTTATIQPYIYFADSSGNRGGLGIKTQDASMHQYGQGGINFYTGSAGFSGLYMTLDSSGRLGIGTTPSSKLEVAGSIKVTGGAIVLTQTGATTGTMGLSPYTNATANIGGFAGNVIYGSNSSAGAGAGLLITCDYGQPLVFGRYYGGTSSYTETARFDGSGHLLPAGDGTQNLGSSTNLSLIHI